MELDNGAPVPQLGLVRAVAPLKLVRGQRSDVGSPTEPSPVTGNCLSLREGDRGAHGEVKVAFVLTVKIDPMEGAGDANPRESGVARVFLGYEAQELGVTSNFMRNRAVFDREGLSGRKKAMIVLTGNDRRRGGLWGTFFARTFW